MTQTTIASAYEADHDRLDGLFKTFQGLKRTDFGKAREAFVDFQSGLKRHIIWEEEILFPLFEQKTGMKTAGPTEVMRREHQQILSILECLHQKVRAQEPDCDHDESVLLSVLSMHNMKEEKILYPAIENLSSGDEVKAVFKKMGEIPRERYT